MLKPKKLLGQNFIKCRWVPPLMAQTGDLSSEDLVLEIGPGTGILSKELLKNAKKVIAIEKDKNLVNGFLKDLSHTHPNLEVVEGDFLKKFPEIIKTHNLKSGSYKLVANIPYYLTSRLLRVVLEQGPQPKTIVLTIQKEVAERLCAKPPKMNLLALSVQVFGQPEIIKAVPANCFWPKPEVDSAIIKIGGISSNFFHKNDLSVTSFFELAKAGFAHKRKTLLNSLTLFADNKEAVKKSLERAGLGDKTRAEEIGLNQWVKLVKNWG